jgi:hypothetical protein
LLLFYSGRGQVFSSEQKLGIDCISECDRALDIIISELPSDEWIEKLNPVLRISGFTYQSITVTRISSVKELQMSKEHRFNKKLYKKK